MRKRKTKDIFIIKQKMGIEKWHNSSFKFDNDELCNEKLIELNKKVEFSKNNLKKDPISWCYKYKKIKKRVKLPLIFCSNCKKHYLFSIVTE